MWRNLFHNRKIFNCIFWLYVLTFMIILPIIGRDLVYSVYVSSSWTREFLQKKVLSDNEKAVKMAEDYLSIIKPFKDIIHNTTARIVINIVTVRRVVSTKPLGYLTRVSTSLHRAIKRHALSDNKLLLICNTHAGPGRHEEADRLKHYFHSVERFPNGSAEASIMNPFEKEKQDYVFCLKQALNFYPDFVLMVEDDAIPRDEVFPVLENLIHYLNSNRFRHYLQWSYLKLYYPERWQGYSFELQKIFELLGLFFIGVTFTMIIWLCSSGQRRFLMSRKEKNLTLLLGGMYFVLLAVTVGRQHLLELKRIFPSLYSLVVAPECCSPCILYPNASAKLIVPYLETVTCSHQLPLDIALSKFTQMQSQNAYLVEPNVFQHIGFISTIKGLSNYPEEYLL